MDLDPDAYTLATDKKKHLMPGDVLLTTCKANSDLFLTPRAVGKPQPKPARAAPRPQPAAAVSAPVVATPAAVQPVTATRKAAPSAKAAPANRPAPAHQAPIEQHAAPASRPPSMPPDTVAKVEAAWRRPKVQTMEAPPQVTRWVAESLTLARSLVVKKSMRQACEAWRQILAVSPGSVECLEGMASVAFDCGKYEEAIDLWCQAVSVSEAPSSKLFASIGRASHASADFVSALVFFNRAIEAKIAAAPGDTCDDLKVLIAKSLAESGQKDAAVQVLTQVLQVSPAIHPVPAARNLWVC